MSEPSQSLKHIPAFDGMRALSVIAVILSHLGLFGWGWLAVQCFFVLSGFLITSILFSYKGESAKVFFGRFYWRRALRIFPLYFTIIASVSIFYLFTGSPEYFSEIWGYICTYTYNLIIFIDPTNLERKLFNNNFRHFWSLSLEEQFYLFWPLLVFLFRASVLRWLLLSIVIFSPLARYLCADYYYRRDTITSRTIWMGLAGCSMLFCSVWFFNNVDLI